MFKNIFLKTFLNVFLLNFNANLSKNDFFKFWGIISLIWLFIHGLLLIDYSVYIKFTEFYRCLAEILIFTLIFTLIYRAKKYKKFVFILIIAFPFISFNSSYFTDYNIYIFFAFLFLILFLSLCNNETNLNINLGKKELIIRLIFIALINIFLFKQSVILVFFIISFIAIFVYLIKITKQEKVI